MSLFPEPFDLPARHLQRFWGVSIEKLSKKNLSKFNEFFFFLFFYSYVIINIEIFVLRDISPIIRLLEIFGSHNGIKY